MNPVNPSIPQDHCDSHMMIAGSDLNEPMHVTVARLERRVLILQDEVQHEKALSALRADQLEVSAVQLHAAQKNIESLESTIKLAEWQRDRQAKEIKALLSIEEDRPTLGDPVDILMRRHRNVMAQAGVLMAFLWNHLNNEERWTTAENPMDRVYIGENLKLVARAVHFLCENVWDASSGKNPRFDFPMHQSTLSEWVSNMIRSEDRLKGGEMREGQQRHDSDDSANSQGPVSLERNLYFCTGCNRHVHPEDVHSSDVSISEIPGDWHVRKDGSICGEIGHSPAAKGGHANKE